MTTKTMNYGDVEMGKVKKEWHGAANSRAYRHSIAWYHDTIPYEDRLVRLEEANALYDQYLQDNNISMEDIRSGKVTYTSSRPKTPEL